jgi:ABC-type nitrate/sulfonate/bicarbonate transport system permease component
MGTTMFTIPYNTTLCIVGVIVLAVVGFVVYGFIKGWENVLREDYEKGPHH